MEIQTNMQYMSHFFTHYAANKSCRYTRLCSHTLSPPGGARALLILPSNLAECVWRLSPTVSQSGGRRVSMSEQSLGFIYLC